jgi:hypothetical protein
MENIVLTYTATCLITNLNTYSSYVGSNLVLYCFMTWRDSNLQLLVAAMVTAPRRA